MINQFKLLFVILFFFSNSLLGNEIQITNLKVEYTKTPLGIDVKTPRFSWQMKSPRNKKGSKQIAYRLVVYNEAAQIVWNSGKVNSDISLNIRYQGEPLVATTRYTWELSVWDNENKKHISKSWFETGLMNSDPELLAWNGAKWIGGSNDDMVLYAHYLPVFRLNYSVQLDRESNTTHASFIYGANDIRLMDKNKNLYHLENKINESYIKIEIDILPLFSGKNARLNIYRVGYSPEDKKNIPFKTYPIPFAIINKENKYQTHHFTLNSNLGSTQIYINGLHKKNLIAEVNLNPLGKGGDFITFPVVGDIGFSVAEKQNAFFSRVEIRNFRNPFNILFSENLDEQIYTGIFANQTVIQNNSYKISGERKGCKLIADPSRNSMPMLRTVFSLSSSAAITKARLYVTSRGIYEVYMNGKRIEDNYFNPGFTQYNKTLLYQTYDVTDLVHQGKNGLGAMLGEGWWSGGITYKGEFWNFFGDRQSVLIQLVITYKDGRKDVIVSNPETWNYFNNSPLVYGSFYQGEVYDATKDSLIDGWSTALYDASQWKQANEVPLSCQITRDSTNLEYNMPMQNDFSTQRIIGGTANSVQKVKELFAISREEVRPGVYIYDMGQNMVGVPEIKLKNIAPGKRIILRYAEVKYPDLPKYKSNAGMLMLENIRAAMAQDIYITKGGDEKIQPRFTFHGYRFIEITGIDEPLPLKHVKGVVLSSVHHLASYYETSHPLVNKLWRNITWSTLGNFISIPTDCPQRNERLGWSGDISVFARSATYLANIPQFFRRHMLTMRDVQRKDGRFSDVAPLGGGFGGILWGSAGITVAWESYLQYGDKELLYEHYPAMKKYIYYLKGKIDSRSGVLLNNDRKKWSCLGDWLSPEYEKSEKSLLWESYFIYDLHIMHKVAVILKQEEDAMEWLNLYNNRKSFFNNTYVDNVSGRTVFGDTLIDTQVSYVLPLAFDIFNKENKKKAVENLVKTVNRKNRADNGNSCPPYSLMTGFIGTAWINSVLSETGHSESAYRLLLQTSYPSWLYPVTQGATTIWERLNSYTHTDGFGGNNRMNSFNHYSFGAVAAWMYNQSLGIQRNEKYPGFKHFILHPEPDPNEEITYAKGYYDSMYGRIKSCWKRKGNEYYYKFVIPANTTATLYLPAESKKNVKKSKDYKILKWEKGKALYKLNSGAYTFKVHFENTKMRMSDVE